jgi:hypothetical protein
MDWGIWAHMGPNPILLGKPARVSLAQACLAEMGCAWFRSLVLKVVVVAVVVVGCRK